MLKRIPGLLQYHYQKTLQITFNILAGKILMPWDEWLFIKGFLNMPFVNSSVI